MKKTSFIILSILAVTALLAWFSCNQFQTNGKNVSSNYSVLDDTNSTRLTITCPIDVNGSTWDGGGITVYADAGFPGGNIEEIPYPMVKVTNGTVRNFTIAPPTYDGIFLYGGNCTVDNVTVPDIGEDIITIKKPGTYLISNCKFNNGEDKVIQVNDLCNITTQSISVSSAGRFMRQNGSKTWKMTSYCIDCTFMNLSECVFRSDSTTSTFFYRNLTTNCATIGYPAGLNGVVTKVVPY